MHPDRIVRLIHACALAGVPSVLWGPPGGGKTARVRSYAESLGIPHVRWLLSRCEPIDLKPRVYSNDDVLVREPPEIKSLLNLGPIAERLPKAVLFLDELNRASREVEGAALDRIDAPPPGVFVIAACNPPSRGQAARSLESAAANRFVHIEVASDPIAFAKAQITGWPNDASALHGISDAAWQKAFERAGAYISAFVRAQGGRAATDDKPAIFDAPPSNPVDAGKAWPSSRTWDYVRRVQAAAMAMGLDAEDMVQLVSGCIGAGAATEYLAYVLDADLPDPDALLADPKSYVPTEGRIDRTVAAMTAVAAALEREFSRPRWEAAWQITEKCLAAEQADAAMVAGELFIAGYKRAIKAEQDKARAANRDITAAAQAFEKQVGAMHKLIPARLAQILSQTGKTSP